MRTLATKARAINQYNGLGNQLWDLAGNRPSLDLRFADDKSLVDATTGTNLINFTRASSGTYVGSDGLIKTATTNEPRFDHDPTTGESLGLLVEEQRVNYCLQSEAFGTSPWSASNVTVTANTETSPAATLTADTLAATSANGTVTQPVTTTAIAMTFSVYLKRKTGTGNIDITADGTTWVTQTINDTTWTRCIVTQTAVAGTSNPGVRIVASGDEVYTWGAQLEAGSFPTSYIPTEGTTVTRAADVASISGSNFSSWYRQDEGSFFVSSREPSSYVPFQSYISSDTVAPDELRLVRTGISSAGVTVVVAGNPEFSGSATILGVPSKIGLGLKASNFYLTVNNGTPYTPATGLMPTLTGLRLGARGNGNFHRNSSISRLTYWPTRLPNETLQGITQ